MGIALRQQRARALGGVLVASELVAGCAAPPRRTIEPEPGRGSSPPSARPLASTGHPSVDFNGDGFADLVIGANGSNSVYAYLGRAMGAPTLAATLKIPSGGDFGVTVATAGDLDRDGRTDVVVGAPAENKVYVYSGTAAGLRAEPTAVLTGPSGSYRFGAAVASAGDLNGDGYGDLVVGTGGGAAYVYLGGPKGLRAGVRLSVSGDFGSSVASAGDVDRDGHGDLIIGSPGASRAYLFRGTKDGVDPVPAATLAVTGAQRFGQSVAGAGDVNGDGYGDVVVGTQSGGVYVYLGPMTGAHEAPWAALAPSGATQFGMRVASAGDLNRDGYGDIVVGSLGSAYVYLGGSAGPGKMPVIVAAPGGTESGQFGMAVAGVGDVDGDGYADLVVGDYQRGVAYLYRGGATLSTNPLRIVGPADSSEFGESVASAAPAAPGGERERPRPPR